MQRKTRLAVVEERPSEDPSIVLLKKKLLTKELSLKNSVYEGLDAEGRDLWAKFSGIMQELQDKSIDFFRSPENIEVGFKKWREEVLDKQPSRFSHIELYEGLLLVLSWCRLQALEVSGEFRAFRILSSDLKPENNSAVLLGDSFAKLNEDIRKFNSKILALQKQRFQQDEVLQLAFSEEDLDNVLTPLVNAENNGDLFKNRMMVAKNLRDTEGPLRIRLASLEKIVNNEVNRYEAHALEKQRQRNQLYQPNLNLDVYYLNDFRRAHPQIFDEYRKTVIERPLVVSSKSKQTAVSALVKEVESNFIKFAKEVDNFANKKTYTWGLAWTGYRKSINLTAAILGNCVDEFKEELANKDWMKKHEAKITQRFISVANVFLLDAESKQPEAMLGFMRSSVLDNYKQAIHDYRKELQPMMVEITPVDDHCEKYRKEIWENAFFGILSHELTHIVEDFNKLCASDDLEKAELQRCFDRLSKKREAIHRFLDLRGLLDAKLPQLTLAFQKIKDNNAYKLMNEKLINFEQKAPNATFKVDTSLLPSITPVITEQGQQLTPVSFNRPVTPPPPPPQASVRPWKKLVGMLVIAGGVAAGFIWGGWVCGLIVLGSVLVAGATHYLAKTCCPCKPSLEVEVIQSSPKITPIRLPESPKGEINSPSVIARPVKVEAARENYSHRLFKPFLDCLRPGDSVEPDSPGVRPSS